MIRDLSGDLPSSGADTPVSCATSSTPGYFCLDCRVIHRPMTVTVCTGGPDDDEAAS